MNKFKFKILVKNIPEEIILTIKANNGHDALESIKAIFLDIGHEIISLEKMKKYDNSKRKKSKNE